MENIFDFSGKTILITGASSGIGRQAAITLSGMGAKTVLVARREEQLKETLAMLSGEGHIYRPFDLTDLDNIDTLVSGIVSETGKLNGLVCCAGIAPTIPVKSTTPKTMQETMQINFFSFYEIARQFIKKKNSADGSKIVAISSMASIYPEKGQSAYSASKAAIDAAVKCMAKELLPRKICINSIRPSFVDTPMADLFCSNIEDGESRINALPLGIIKADEISSMISYLLSPAADRITGTSFNINGGNLL